MKNIQVIDGALNCTYSIFAVEDDVFEMLFSRALMLNSTMIYSVGWVKLKPPD